MSKLTLSIDDKIIEKAKEYALVHHTSISKMFENYLQEITHNQYVTDSELGTKTRSLLSARPLITDKSVKELLGDSLAEKYL